MRLPKFPNIQTLLQYYISQYYLMRSQHPGIKQDPKKHKKEILQIEGHYKRELRKKLPDLNSEENQNQFRKEIDFLTGIFSKEEKEKRRKEELKLLLKK